VGTLTPVRARRTRLAATIALVAIACAVALYAGLAAAAPGPAATSPGDDVQPPPPSSSSTTTNTTTTTTAPSTAAPNATGPLGQPKLRRVKGAVTGGFQVAPPRTTDTIEPGKARDYGLTVLNQTGKPRRFTLTVHDLVPGRGGSYADLVDAGTAPRGSGQWLQLAAPSVELDNLQQAIIPVRVSVPAAADAGGHYAGIQVSSSDPGQTGDEVNVRTAIVAHFITIVPGDVRYDIKLNDFRVPSLTSHAVRARATVTNTGNIHPSPSARLVLRGIGIDRSISVDVPELLPGGTRTITIEWKRPPHLGRVDAHIEAAAEDGDKVRTPTRTIWLWSTPALVTGVALLVVVIAGLVYWRRSREWKRLLAEVSADLYDDEDADDGAPVRDIEHAAESDTDSALE
jgi:hypothetical protein